MFVFAAAASLFVAGFQGVDQAPLKIDPLLVCEASEAWKVIARKDNPVWPGWDASDTPVLIYLPGVQDLLINHPKPPLGFTPYAGPIRFPTGQMMLKNGPTLERFDGQNTSRDVNGVQTLVVSDTLSRRRQSLESLVQQARSDTGDMAGAISGLLQSDSYDNMTLFVHEAFHVYQHKRAPDKGGNESVLTNYPSLSVENNVGYALEADALRAAASTASANDVRKLAVRWLAVRNERRKALSPASIEYEDGTEFNEGLAEYTQYRFLQVMEKRKPSPQMWFIQGFRGYADLSRERAAMIEQMGQTMEGKAIVNNDLYGASPVRRRLYFSGMGVGALLDRLGAKWHDRILEPGTTLTGLVADARHASPAELQAAYAEVTATPRFTELRENKERLAMDGQAYVEKEVAELEKAPAQLVIDYSGLAKPRLGLGYTPFGILRIDENRTLYRLLPIRGDLNGMTFAEDSNRPVLQDRSRKQMTFTLREAVSEAVLDQAAPGWRTGTLKVESLKLPGVTLNKVNATIRIEGKKVVLQAQ